MKEVRARRLVFSLLTSAIVLASVSQLDAEMIFFANGRMMSVHQSLVARIAPDELPEVEVHDLELPATEQVSAAPPTRRPLESRPFAAMIEMVALKHGIDPALVHAVVQAESNYRATAQSQVGARGLMQVMPSTARDLGVRSAKMLFDPQANLEAGVKYLKFLLERFNGDLVNALAAYNAGPGAVRKYDGVPPFRETENYVRKVLANLQH
jgi:soluble lytic murein transglycosylase-like protein